MKNLNLKSLATAICLLFSLGVSAYDFTVDGMYFNVVSLEDLTCEITSGDEEYAGDFVIPEKVTYNGRTFTVTRIDGYYNSYNDFDGTFYKCTNLNSQIPESLFYNATNVITLRNAFNISGVTGNIPEKLFINQSQLTLRSCFRYCSGLSDSQIRLTAQNIRETDYFCEGVNAKITVYIPRGMENPFTSTSNVTVVEYDI